MTLLLLTPENDDLGNCPGPSDLHSWSVSNLDLLIRVPMNGFSGFFTEHHAVHADARRGGQLRNRGGSLLRDPARNKFGSAEGSSKKLPTFFSPRNQQWDFFYGWISNSFVLYEYHETIICKLKPKAKNQWDDNAQIGLGARRRRGITLP